MTRFVPVVVVALFAVSPAFAQSAAERQLAADVRMLEQRIERIEMAISDLRQAGQELDKQMAEQVNAARKLAADQTVRLNEALDAVRVLREQLAETHQQLTANLEKSNAPAGATELFEQARADYMAGNYPLAVQGFSEFLKTAPQHSNVALAKYYVGEAYRQDRKPTEALAAYQRVIVEHPKSEQMPNARVRHAEILNELGRVKEARAEYETVVKESPDTNAATLARQRLAALGR